MDKEKNTYEKWVHDLLNKKWIAALGIAMAAITVVLGFVKTVAESQSALFPKDSASAVTVPTNLKSDTSEKQEIEEEYSQMIDTDTITINGTVDFFTLLSNLSSDPEYDEMQRDWAMESDNEGISWITDGYTINPDYEIASEDYSPLVQNPYLRTGVCILSNQGKSLYTYLGKRSISVRWDISYYGPSAGVFAVVLNTESDGLSFEYAMLERVLKNRAKITKLKGEMIGKDKELNVAPDTLIYDVRIPNKSRLKITEITKYGTNSCEGKTFIIQ